MNIRPYHVGISITNMEESIRWYNDVFAFELVRLDDVEPLRAKIAFLRNGDFEIELFEHWDRKPLPEERKHPNADMITQGTKHICFAVTDFAKMMEHLRNKEVIFALGPQEMFGTEMCFVRDPSGILIELIGVEK